MTEAMLYDAAKVLLGLLLTLAGSWALVRQKTEDHATQITAIAKDQKDHDNELIEMKAATKEKAERIMALEKLVPVVSQLGTAVAVLASKHDEHGSRIDRFSAELREVERRLLEHIDRLAAATRKAQP